MALTFPLPGAVFKRNDEGVDLQQTANNGTNPLFAIASGTVTYAGPDPGGFGPRYPILTFDQPVSANGGPFPACYYGHCLGGPPPGTHVNAGDVVGTTTNPSQGNASGIAGGGWLEIGFWNNGPTGPSGTMWGALSGAVQPGPGGAPAGSSAGASGFQDPLGYDDGPTLIPTTPNPGMSDPINNRPILWAQNVTPITFGGNAFPGERGADGKPIPVDPTYGQLLHGSMKTVGSVNQAVPNFLIYFMWNPATITWNYAFNTDILPQALQNTSVKGQVSFLNGQSVQFTLIFDRVYEVGYFVANGQAPKLSFDAHGMWDSDPNKPSPFTMGVQWDVRAFERLMGIYDNTTTQASGAPANLSPSFAPGGSDFTAAVGGGSIPLANAVDVALGSDNAPVFRGYFQSGCQVRYTRFAQNMTPTRCEIDVAMISLFLPNREQISSGQGTNPYISTPTRY